MKILYGITKSNFGGAQRYVFELAVEMKKQEHNVAVLCGGAGVLVDKLRDAGLRVIRVDKMQRDISVGKEFLSFFDTLRVLRIERPDIFHINSSKMGGLGGLAGRLAGIKKIIFTAHGWAFNEPRPVWQKILIKFFTWITILLAHKTICVSEKTKKDVVKWPFIKNKLVVIHNGINVQDYVISSAIPLADDEHPQVGTVAELHKVKGLDVLLEAWAKFRKNHSGILNILGSGEEKQNLENMAKNLNISDSVRFVNFIVPRKQYKTFLAKFDIFVLPSRSEAMPYTILEAGAIGMPVIATSVGGIPEIIENGMNGILIPSENSEILFSSLILLAEDKDLRKRLGANLKLSIQENFSLKKMVSDTFSIYQ